MKLNCLVLLLLLLSTACDRAPQAVYPDRRGGRGESCLVTNDCKEPLLCLGGRCLDREPAISPSENVCIAAECYGDADCCPAPSPAQKDLCDAQKSACRNGSESSCSFVASECDCKRTCKDHLCSGSERECTNDDDCYAGSCRAGKCVECREDAECGKGFVCESRFCQRACTHDEACGPLAKCSDGRCESRDCASDRECAFLLGARDAVCRDGDCIRPCATDAECVSPSSLGSSSSQLSTCIEGACKFLGCETNAECGALFRNYEGSLPACVSQREADAFSKALSEGP